MTRAQAPSRPRPGRPALAAGHAALLGVLHGAIVIVLVTASLVSLQADEVQAFHFAAAAETYVALFAFYRAYRLTGDAINGLSLSMFVMLLLYPFHGVIMQDSEVVLRLLGSERYRYFTYGLLVAVPGTWLIYRGFMSGRAGRFALAVERWSRVIDDRSPGIERKLWAFAALAVGARVLQVALGTGTYIDLEGTSSTTGSSAHFILSVLSSSSLITGLYLLASGGRYKLRRRQLMGAAVILMEAAWGGLFSGSRYLLFLPLLSAAAVLSMSVKALELRRLVLILVLFFAVLFPIATAYRNTYLSRLVDLQREGLSASVVMSSIAATEVDENTSEGWEEAIGLRFHALTSLAVIIRYTPERHPYIYGLPYLLLPLDILVPRVVWPDKPTIREFATEFRFDYFELDRGTRTAVKPSQFGELWANLHLFGVLLGAWVWGRVLRFMYSFLFVGGRASVFGAVTYAAALPWLITVLEGELVTGLAFVAKNLIVWLAWAWLLGTKRPTPPRPARRRARWRGVEHAETRAALGATMAP